ncbi:MAG TPA: transcriptional regulator [Lachnospiraceae bacterium]|nr:transcriptional regulator [Lachnospiraceae bacterium]
MGNSNRRPSAQDPRNRRRSKRKAKKKRGKFILLGIEVLVLAVLVFVLIKVIGVTEKTDHVKFEDDVIINDGAKDAYAQVAPGSKSGETIQQMYKQVVLFGVDSREGQLNKGTRTDTIIIASINKETNEIKLCSVFRDTYLNLSNDDYNKCNSAYAKGGPEQAINMLNMNLDMNIENYITVGFKGVVKTVDSLGGVPIDVQSNEISHLNNYQYCMNDELNLGGYTEVTSTGLQTLNGLQATAYCRIRYTGDGDFTRARRQRDVVTQMSEKAKQTDVTKLVGIAEDALNYVSTNFTSDEIIDVAKNASKYTVVGSDGFPFESNRTTGTIGSKGSCVIPKDLTTNVTMLHKFFFDVDDYDPSDKVKECSDKVAADTNPYL